MDINDAVSLLNEQFKSRDWFVKVVAKQQKPLGIILYTKWQTGEILREVPETIGGYQVLVHYYYETTEPKVLDLDQELATLYKIYGKNVVESVFYEEHDGKNCVTNFSEKFSDLKNTMHLLYKHYGFNAIYEKM
jgi:hypothetical protein